MNPFPYSLDNKRYHTYNYFLKMKYRTKVAKASLNADFTCPNRDGNKAYGGCTFCSSLGSGDFAGDINQSLMEQFQSQKVMISNKWPDCRFIAYFQAFTNTYAPLDSLKKRFEPFANLDEVAGIAIATRADCVTEEIASYLEELDTRKDVYVELGLQTIHDKTASLINRQETFEEFKNGLNLLRKHHLHVCVHIINGLPYETINMMVETAKEIGKMDIQAIKIHSLYLTYHSVLYQQYLKNPFPLLTRDDYIHLIVKQLEYLPAHIVIERLTGDAPGNDLFKPEWSRNKTTILNDIDKYMAAHHIIQGDLL
ncbi:TIGR01212 family radical SAM protein [Eggerthia catenaformis]